MYVVDVPANKGHMQMRAAPYRDGIHGDTIYHSELAFTTRLMRDWSLRTLNQAEARLFYVPTWMYFTAGNAALATDRYRELLRLQLPGNTAQRVFYLR
jgi:hypothetical protein